MDVTLAVFLSLTFGLVVGGGFVALVNAAASQRERISAALDPRPPEGVERALEALGAAAFVTDPSHNILVMTAGAGSMGFARRGGRLDDRLGALVDEARDTGAAVDAEIEMPRGPFGSAELHLHVRAARVTGRHFVVMVEDRTEARRVESVRRDFVANVSHELKTPIGAITLLAEALTEAADDEEQVRYFTGRLETEATRLKRLTNELLDLSRLQSTDSLEHATIVDTGEIIDLAVDQARVAADAKGVRITTNAPRGMLVFGDAGLLLMAFHNLVSNAVNYSAEGSPIGVGARILDEAVEISVTDQGIGIAPEDTSRIFERFYRADPARSRRTGGSGLGLSIVKHIVENHGGDIRVWSRVGKGSTFTVRLPLVEDAERRDAYEFDDFGGAGGISGGDDPDSDGTTPAGGSTVGHH
ncbi:two-component sensor histidine kinase [Pseudoclavibacter endophyticus]|uniref:Sensor-like histidine kinase SenX3 n=1 Tax=Pseudoclavibacter endophyticus TaxID=1778590 RepID=A0A6H9WKR7_9MICO|nr:ATP-binding protein [Pseudoclavibacter endophyticus]KAB1649406.1 two-component sensor histidine kinase [Pseudoclavibacter endophyticus]GGA62906.1 two-component sensor histidine kinase [Pseudoclavibacter endophyticus]